MRNNGLNTAGLFKKEKYFTQHYSLSVSRGEGEKCECVRACVLCVSTCTVHVFVCVLNFSLQ